MNMDPSPTKPAILRLRAGLLMLTALGMLCVSAGRFVAVQLSAGWVWGLVAALALAAALAFALTRLTKKLYFAIAALFTLLVTYLAFDFLRGALGWSSGMAFLFALIPFAILAATFWDFRKLKLELTGWLNAP